MIHPEQYIKAAKVKLGNPSMSDRELGEVLGYSTPTISGARYGKMPDPLAIKVAELIEADPGEVMSVARAYREKDVKARAILLGYVAKTLAAMPSKVAPTERGGMAAMVDQLTAGKRRKAAAVLLAIGLVGGVSAPSPAEAAVNGWQLLDAVHYVKWSPQESGERRLVHSRPTRTPPSDGPFSVNTVLTRRQFDLLGP